MVATISTSTSAVAVASSSQRKYARFGNGVDLAMYQDGSNNLVFKASRDAFTTVGSVTGNIASATNGSVDIASDNTVHVVYAYSGSVYYRIGVPTFDGTPQLTAITWSSAVTIASTGYDNYPDVIAHLSGTDRLAEIVWSYLNGTVNKAQYQRVKTIAGGSPAADGSTIVLGGSYGAAQDTYPCIAWDGSTRFGVTWSAGVSGVGLGERARIGTWSGLIMTWGAEEAVTESNYGQNVCGCAFDSVGRLVVVWSGWLLPNSSLRLYVTRRYASSAVWEDLGDSQSGIDAAFAIDSADAIHVLSRSSGMFYSYFYNGAWTWAQLDSNDFMNLSACRKMSGKNIDAVYQSRYTPTYTITAYRKLTNRAPLKPTPAQHGNFDTNTLQTFTWTFNDTGDSQSQYELHIYYADSPGQLAYGSGTVTSTQAQHVLPTNSIPNANRYFWQVKTYDTAGVVSLYSDNSYFYTSTTPTCAITNPAADGATVASSKLTATHTFTDPDAGATQSAYQYVLTTSTDVVLWDSGKVLSSATSVLLGYALPNSSSFKLKLTVWDSKDIQSATVTRTFVTSFVSVAPPTMSVNPLSDSGYIGVTWVSPAPYHNYLSANHSNIETDTAGYSVVGTATIARDTTWAWQGSASLKITSATDQTANNAKTSTIPVAAGMNIASAYAYNPGASTISVSLSFGGESIATFPIGAGQVVRIYTTYNKVGGGVVILRFSEATGQPFHIDGVMLTAGETLYPWIVGQATTPICSYVDLYRDGVRIATNLLATGSYPDFNIASGTTYTYFVRAIGDNSTYADSTAATGIVTFTSGGMWLHTTTDPQGTSHFYQYREQAREEVTVNSQDFEFVGRSYPVTRFDATQTKRTISVRIAIPDDTTDRAWLTTVFYLRSTLCFRDQRGRRMFCVLKSLPIEDERWGGFVSAQFEAVDYVEAV